MQLLLCTLWMRKLPVFVLSLFILFYIGALLGSDLNNSNGGCPSPVRKWYHIGAHHGFAHLCYLFLGLSVRPSIQGCTVYDFALFACVLMLFVDQGIAHITLFFRLLWNYFNSTYTRLLPAFTCWFTYWFLFFTTLQLMDTPVPGPHQASSQFQMETVWAK